MNEQLLKDLVATAQKYKYDWNTVLPKFPEFKGYDAQLLKDYVATAEKYKYDYATVNSKFPEFKLKKKEPTASLSPSGQKPTSSVTPAKKASGQPDYLSPTSDLGPKSPKMEFDYKTKKEAVVGEYKGYPGKEDNTYRVYNGNWQRKMPKQTNWQDVLNEGSVNALNKQFNQAVKYSKAKDKYKGVVEDKRELAKNELDTKLSSINSKLIDKEEDVVIPKLQKQFPNFKFAPSGTLTDEVKVIAPNNETIIISLDNWSSSSDTSEAELLRSFIRINSNTDKTAAEKELQQAEKQREYFDIKPFNPTIKIGEGYGDEKIITDLNKIVQPEGAPTDIMTADKELKSARKELMKQSEIAYIDVIDKVRVAAKTSGKIDDNEARADLAMLKSDWKETKAGEDYFNDISTQSTELKKQWTDLQTYVDGINTKLSIGEISQEQYENEYVPLMQKGLEDLQGKSLNLNNEYTTVQNVNNSIVRSSAENMIIQESRGSIAGGVAYGFTKGLTDVLRVATLGNLPKEAQEDLVRAVVGYGTTEEYMNSEERSDITKVLFSLSRTLGQAATGSFIGKGAALAGGSAKAVTTASAIPFFSSAYYEMKDQFDDPKFANISDAQKVLFSALYGTASAALEKYGLTKSLSKTPFGKNLTNTILASAIKGLPKNASEEAIKEAIEASIVNKIKSAGVSSIGAFVVEGATEATQKATEVALQESFDLLNKDNYFESGTAWDILSDVIYEGYLGGLGGSMMNVASNGARIATDGISKVLNKEQAKVLDIMTQTEGMNESFDTYLKGLVVSGDITPEEAGSMSNGFREVKAGFDKIPADIPVDQKTKAFDLIIERSKIEKEISGKEDNLVVAQKERIKEINNELQTISKDANKEGNIQEVDLEAKRQEASKEIDSLYTELKSKGLTNEQIVSDPSYQEALAKERELFLKINNPTTKESTSQIEDIEKRREEDLSTYNEEGLNETYAAGSDQTVGEFINAKYDAELAALGQPTTNQTVETLRAKEQVELAEAIPNIDEYKVDGEVDKNSMPADVLAKYNEIYDKYDKLITPLLTTAQEGTTVEQEITPESYVEELNNTIESDPETYWSVSPVDLETAKDSTIVGDSDGKGIVSKDGDIKGVFKSIGTKVKGVAEKILSAAVKVGGIKLDNFDGYLTKTYKKNGFRIVARVPFNEEFAPNGWNKEKHGTPDVVAMIYDPEGKLSIEEKSFTDYDEAMAYRDTFVEQARANKQIPSTSKNQVTLDNFQELENQAVQEGNDTKIKTLRAARMVLKSLPGVKVFIHNSPEEYQQALADASGTSLQDIIDEENEVDENGVVQRSAGQYVNGEIHVDGSIANERTVYHEAFHDAILKAGLSVEMAKGLLKIISDKKIKSQLEAFISQYESSEQNEEMVSELGAIMAEAGTELSTTKLQQFKQLINKLAQKLGLPVMLPASADRQQVVDFINTMSKAIRTGRAVDMNIKAAKDKTGITEEINPTAPDTGTGVDTSSLENRKKSLIQNLGLVRQKEITQRLKTGVKLSDLGRVISHLTFSDRLVTGKVGDKDYLGGILFAAATNRVWASFSKGRVSSIINGMPVNKDGYRYLMPALLTEQSHMSNKDMMNTSLKLVEDAVINGDVDFNSANDRIRKALNRKGLEKYLEIYNKSIGDNITAKSVKNAIDQAIVNSDSTFENRKTFLEALLGKADIDLTKRFGNLPSFSELANGLAEPITEGHEYGDILLVIRTKGNLIAVQPKEGDADYHPSYPWVIRSVDENGDISDVETLIFDKSYNAINVFPKVTNKSGKTLSYQDYVDRYGDKAKSAYLGYIGGRTTMSTSLTEEVTIEAEQKEKVAEVSGERKKQKAGGKKVTAQKVNQSFKNPVKKVIVNDRTALKNQLRLEAKAARESQMDLKQKQRALIVAINKMKRGGLITVNQASILAKRLAFVNVDNPIMVERFLGYAEKLFGDAEYSAKLNSAFELQKKIKKAIKSDKLQASVVATAKAFSKLNPSLVEDIDAYIENANTVFQSVVPSRTSGLSVDLKTAMDINAVGEYVDAATEFENEYKKKELMQVYKDLVESGVITNDMSLSEIKELVASITNEKEEGLTAEDKKAYIMSWLGSTANIYRPIIKSMLNGRDPFTGDDVVLSEKQDKIMRDFLKIDVTKMDVREAMFVVEAMDNFITNKITDGLETVIEKYNGNLEAKKLADSRFKTRSMNTFGTEKSQARKIFGKGSGRLWAQEMMSLKTLTDLVFRGVNNAQKITKAMGLSAYENGVALANRLWNNSIDSYYKEFKKTKPNGEKFMSAKNIYERGMYAALKRTVPGNQQVQDAEFKRKIKLINDSISTLMKGSERDQEIGKMYSEVAEKLGINEAGVTMLDIESRVDSNNMKAVDWWVSKWADNYSELADVSQNVYNTILDRDMYYTPDKFSSTKPLEKSVEEVFESGGAFGQFLDYEYDKKSGVLMPSAKQSSMAEGRFLDLNFDMNNSKSLKAALVDMKTATSIRKISGFLKSKDWEKVMTAQEDRDVFRKKIDNYILRSRNKSTGAIDNDYAQALDKAGNIWASMGAARALGGFTQPLKQTIPVLVSTIINSGRVDFAVGKDQNDWISKIGRGISNRGLESQAGFEDANRMMDDAANSGNAVKILAAIEKSNRFVLRAVLAKPDVFIARSSFISYYKQYMANNGMSEDINYSKPEDANQDALDYAQRMIDRQQNVSDGDLAGELMASNKPFKKLTRNILLPFASFAINQKSRMFTDFATLMGKEVSSQDRVLAIRSLSGLAAEIAVFNAIAFGIKAGVIAIAGEIVPPAPEDEKEKEKELWKQWGYIIGNVIASIISPVPLTDSSVISSSDWVYKQVNKIAKSSSGETKEALKKHNEERELNGQRPLVGREADRWMENHQEEDRFKIRAYTNENMAGTYTITYNNLVNLQKSYDLAFNGEYKQDMYGKVQKKYILKEDRDVLKYMWIGNAITNIAGFPSEYSSVNRRVENNVKKKSAISEKKFDTYNDVVSHKGGELNKAELFLVKNMDGTKSQSGTDRVIEEIEWIKENGGFDNERQMDKYIEIYQKEKSVNSSDMYEIKKIK